MSDLPNSDFVWHELMSRDPDASERFYRDVAGLSARSLPGAPGPYRLLVSGERPIGGVAALPRGKRKWPSGGPQGHWISYLGTSDVAAAVSRAKELGGQVLLPPTDVPGVGRAAVVRDPDGAAFGLFEARQGEG